MKELAFFIVSITPSLKNITQISSHSLADQLIFTIFYTPILIKREKMWKRNEKGVQMWVEPYNIQKSWCWYTIHGNQPRSFPLLNHYYIGTFNTKGCHTKDGIGKPTNPHALDAHISSSCQWELEEDKPNIEGNIFRTRQKSHLYNKVLTLPHGMRF